MENLRVIREKRGFTQINLSIKLEVAQETISGYEVGKSNPSVENLEKLADILGTSTDYLLGRTDDDRPVKHYSQDTLPDNELSLLIRYRALSEENKARLEGYLTAIE